MVVIFHEWGVLGSGNRSGLGHANGTGAVAISYRRATQAEGLDYYHYLDVVE